MSLRSCWFPARWNNNFKRRRVSTAALQNFRSFPARPMTQDLPSKHEQQHISNPVWPSRMSLVKDVFHDTTIISSSLGLTNPACGLSFCKYPASILDQDTSIASNIFELAQFLTCQIFRIICWGFGLVNLNTKNTFLRVWCYVVFRHWT